MDSRSIFTACVKPPGVSAALSTIQIVPGATERHALSGGDEYELLYTSLADAPGIEIGRIESGPAGQLSLRGIPIDPCGLRPLSVTV